MIKEIWTIIRTEEKVRPKLYFGPLDHFFISYLSFHNAIGPYWSYEEALKVCKFWEGGGQMLNEEELKEPCAYCGSTVNVSLQADPYELEIRGRVNYVYICERCFEVIQQWIGRQDQGRS